MTDFTRNINPENIFEGNLDENVEIFLKFKEDAEISYSRNQDNELKFEQALRFLSDNTKVLLFPKKQKK
jgi:hypothetical protein